MLDRTKIIHINGVEYLTPKTFASTIDKSTPTVWRLIKKGNSIRKLNSVKIGSTILIPLTELIDYPFTLSGNKKLNNKNEYHYNKEGEVINSH